MSVPVPAFRDQFCFPVPDRIQKPEIRIGTAIKIFGWNVSDQKFIGTVLIQIFKSVSYRFRISLFAGALKLDRVRNQVLIIVLSLQILIQVF